MQANATIMHIHSNACPYHEVMSEFGAGNISLIRQHEVSLRGPWGEEGKGEDT
jgi:hypothetical protein